MRNPYAVRLMRKALGFLALILAVLAATYLWPDEKAPALDTERVEEAPERVELSQPVDEQVDEASSSRSAVPGQADQLG